MSFRRTLGIVSNNDPGAFQFEADLIITAVTLGFSIEQRSLGKPVRFDMEAGSQAEWDAFVDVVHRIDSAVSSYFEKTGTSTKGNIQPGLTVDHTKGAVIVGVYDLADHNQHPNVSDPVLSRKGQALYEDIKSEHIQQYTGYGAYTGFVDNHNSIGETDPIGPLSTARFLTPDPYQPDLDNAEVCWHSRWLPAKDSDAWKSRLRYGVSDSYIPWGLIGGEKAGIRVDKESGGLTNLADKTTEEMENYFHMHYEGYPGENDSVGYVHGMTQAIYKAYDLGPSCTPYEITVGERTTKLASCLACTVFMTATGYPPTATHLGRGDSWSPLYKPFAPDGSEPLAHEHDVIRDLNTRWAERCSIFLSNGLQALKLAGVAATHVNALAATYDYLEYHNEDAAVAVSLLLDALTVHGRDWERIARTLANPENC